jgi:hypothetical protein
MFKVSEWHEHVPLFGHPFQQEDYRRARALNRILRDSEFFGHQIGGAKTDSSDCASEQIWIAAHQLK